MANKIYVAQETALDWTDDTTGGDYTLDLGSLAAGSVRVGDRGDLGSASRAFVYEWRMVIDGFDSSPVVGEAVEIYIATSEGTYEDGDVGTTDAAGSTVQLPNLLHVGNAVVQTTTAGDNLQTSGIVEIYSRYVTPVVYNATADALLGTSDAHHFYLTPMPPEVQ